MILNFYIGEKTSLSKVYKDVKGMDEVVKFFIIYIVNGHFLHQLGH